ncbi:methyl farnesoate epoxidase [Neodiprion pinetum]|uniref:Methyl farnesoate epoxidase n=1 Tax=Neodiprion lecontei TaxID=441921 RepID=A0A6J0BZ73_NEOLC|nr:methyl farnesoate epoxidase [Neodiprion lecontei]XP_046418296.1 methyl farnesoate epoxidase-like [Neodiprion fabricii]XP_046470964.1 methyl farnesoate epoxidase-like [Neodiprion pinetum]XP_046609573.1 methyl farnesoate epoxidase-like [Neodiprion virginianus]
MFPAAILLAVCAFVLFCVYDSVKPANFPPGPRWLPFVGCFPRFYRLRSKYGYVHLAMRDLAEKYGSVLGIKLGKQRIVIVSTHELIRKVLTQEEFNGRPDGFFFRVRAFGERRGVLFTDGIKWSQHRRFSLRHLRSFGFGHRKMQNQIVTEAENLVKFLHNQSLRGPVPMHGAFDVAVINSLWLMFAGRRFDYSDQRLTEILQVTHDAFRLIDTSGGILCQLPFLRFICPELSGYKSLMTILRKLWSFLAEEINEHVSSLPADEPRDLIDAFLMEISRNESSDSHDQFNHEELLVLCLDLFLAGSETTSNTLSTMLIYLVLNPEWLEKLQMELSKVVGRDRPPNTEDRSSLPEMEAFLAEVQRSVFIAPLGVPHRTVKDVCLNGYRIPKDTVVLVNYYSVHHERLHWKDPEVFRPQRFLNANGVFMPDDFSIPFGLGKRRCLGEVLARNSLFLYLAYVLHYFDINISEKHGPPNPNGNDGFTISPKPFYLVLSHRNG